MIQRPTYGELVRLFIRMSLTAFGGPVAHIAMGEDEIVRRRGWLTHEQYLDLIAATNLIPGPNSTEVMIHVGYVTRGILGAILSGLCFILPAALISLTLAMLYVSGGGIPQVQALLWGIQPVIVAIITVAAIRLAPSALKNRALWILAFAGVIGMVALDLPEVMVILGSGLIYALYQTVAPTSIAAALIAFIPTAQTVINIGENARASALDLFWYFLKIGSVLFGSGYVLVTYIQTDLVETLGWLSPRELLDAIAIGQFTPGPVSTASAVVGYIVAGVPGGLAALLGVFLPSFILVILTAPLISRMRKNRFLAAFLDGTNAGVLAAITLTVVQLAVEALRPLHAAAPNGIAGVSVLALILFALALIGMLRFKLNATVLVLIGAGIGFIYGMLV